MAVEHRNDIHAMTKGPSLLLAVTTILVVGACQSPKPRPATEHSASQSQSLNCAPMLVPANIVATYPPNAKPGFNSPEQVTALLEKRWPLDDIRKFAIPERRHNDEYQNLVPSGQQIWGGRLYCDQATGFDSIEWYANVKNGPSENSLREFSLGAIRGHDYWLLEMGSPDSVQKPPDIEPDFRVPTFVGHK
jgi:hypothetical protein